MPHISGEWYQLDNHVSPGGGEDLARGRGQRDPGLLSEDLRALAPPRDYRQQRGDWLQQAGFQYKSESDTATESDAAVSKKSVILLVSKLSFIIFSHL